MKRSLFSDYAHFLMGHKKYWLVPLVVIFVLLGTLVVLLESRPLASFIYSIF
jgi:Family of unknown function (DUF5989)